MPPPLTKRAARPAVVPAVGILSLLLAMIYSLSGPHVRQSSGGGRIARQMLENNVPALSIVPTTQRGEGLVPVSERKACAAISKRHREYASLLDRSLCKQLDANYKESQYIKCQANTFIQAGSTKQERPGLACKPLGVPGKLLEGTAVGVPCSAHGCCDAPIFLRQGTRDCGVFQQVFPLHFYKYMYPIAQKFSPKYILDAGGNAGFSTMMFKLLWPDAVVVGMEPDPENFKVYQKNTAAYSGVHAVNAGLWGHRARLAPVEEKTESWGKVFREVDMTAAEGIDAYGIKDVAEMFSIPYFDFVKMDIEGAEGRVFLPEEDLSWLDDVRLLIMEVHDEGKQYFDLQELHPQVVAALSSTKMQLGGVEDGEHMFLMREDLLREFGVAPAAATSEEEAGATE